MRTLARLSLISSLALVLACGDDGGTDSGTDTGVSDTGGGDTGGGDTGGGDTGGGDTGTADAGDTGTGPTCFPLSLPTSKLPDAIPVTLDGTSDTWMRPTGEVCPATGLGAEAVPYDSVCYVNDTAADITFLFEVTGSDDPAPAAVIYDGAEIPADRMACAAVSSDLVIDVAEATHTVSPGAMVTLVGTFQDPGTGDVTLVITPE